MRKINEQTLKEASNCLNRAWRELAKFSCCGVGCKDCPMWCEEAGKCLACLVSRHARSAKLEVDYNDNH